MKTTKRVLAVVLAALMLACMIPFAASAANNPATSTSVTLTCSKPGYTFEIYQLATLEFKGEEGSKTTSGLYTFADPADITADIKADIQKMGDTITSGGSTSTIDSKKLLADCDAAYENKGDFGTKVSGDNGTFTSSASATSKSVTLPAGVFYVVCTDAPDGVTGITNSVFATPYYDNGWKAVDSINLGSKVFDETPDADKKVRNIGDNTWSESITESLGKDFQFKILTKVAGSAAQKVDAYRVVDFQPQGIDFVQIESVKTVKANKTDVVKDNVSYTKVTNDLPSGATFGVNINNVDDLYETDVKYVEVIYTAKLNTNAVVAGNGNINKARLQWKPNGKAEWSSTPDDDAKVFTYNVTIEKVDNADTTKKLQGAVFEIYDNAQCTGTKLATATTGQDGRAKFKKDNADYTFKEGTYYFKEVTAPAGYNLSTEIYSVAINANTSDTTANFTVCQIKNSKNVLPETGGAGTLVFTIVGISLILAAGVLFVIVMKKRSSK